MRPISRAHLARQLAAAITDAACEEQGSAWSGWEVAHASASTPVAAAAAADAAMTLCSGCPETERCAQRAELDSYTGLAAGAAYLNGVRKPTTTVVFRPEPPQRKAG